MGINSYRKIYTVYVHEMSFCTDILTMRGKHLIKQLEGPDSHLLKLQSTLVQTPAHIFSNSRKSYSCKTVCVPLLASTSGVLLVALASSDLN